MRALERSRVRTFVWWVQFFALCMIVEGALFDKVAVVLAGWALLWWAGT